MSLARAVTKRIKRSEVPKVPTAALPSRSQTIKSPVRFDRSNISLPVALVSTTNMLSYNAPNIDSLKKKIPSSTTSTHSSGEDSDHSISGRSRASSHSSRHTTLTDASSVDESPTSPVPNHLSGFFAASNKQIRKSASTTSLHRVREETVEFVPAIPQRAPSHSKRAHERIAKKRSVQSITPPEMTKSGETKMPKRKSREQRSSVDIFKGAIEEEAHPFDRELKQLNEVAEEFVGVAQDAETEADMNVMRSMNLAAFCAADYLAEIRPLFSDRFGMPRKTGPVAWI